ncbi:2-dehydro-3-deoxy-6-phosphogalactonate aldolase [Mangrovibrevibacter kandeliae]|uniref:2-dehydro-3-deoxy-6-phosphogalactonate aldolase n=1 Tax=Mangrovibrevibacter kandeliae TaxID=2968473 RepID=UPI0021173713|nr:MULTISPECIES: 2-dehydro-3-deoxy-6-phosphogalactonate aldolase [unclassified Aurantimonas]MCQ8783377.1 2-dehydro-3-deoxy-6-phosphogalactonate aldolase [Aurantimonas sp. CSK15Z-1]MCW4116107.1 2-dehydro-3-deoxy-6-phosphogalactonate aldolase [Aurantimonas sp. MSK8Z-1]
MSERVRWPDLGCNLVAILRGLQPSEVEAVVGGLIEVGFEAIEIPLNSPEPFRSIETAAKMAPSGVYIGAGTVLEVEDVDRLKEAGGRLLVSPNVEPQVILRAGAHGMVTMPGVFTATEAFTALKAGASGLKFFPASVLGPTGIGALMAVLPKGTVVGAVGGVSEENFQAFGKAGVTAFGLGSSLFKPGMSAAEVIERGRRAVAAYHRVFAQGDTA